MDPMLLSIVVALLVVILATLMWFKSGNDKGKEAPNRPRPQPRQQGQNVVVGARNRRGMQRRQQQQQQQQQEQDEDDENEDGGQGQAEIDAEVREELEEAGIKIPDGKVGKKKLAKLQEKAERKKAREAEERQREMDKKKRAENEAKEAEERLKEEELEKAKLEEEEKRRLEKERQEHEEYLKLKAAFEVEEEGFDDELDDESAQENKLQQFIDYIVETKVVVLEDLAAHFSMKTQDAIDRVTELQTEARLTGVIDDRGKFIYISRKELEDVAKFIKQRGRVSVSELADASNKLINMKTA